MLRQYRYLQLAFIALHEKRWWWLYYLQCGLLKLHVPGFRYQVHTQPAIGSCCIWKLHCARLTLILNNQFWLSIWKSYDSNYVSIFVSLAMDFRAQQVVNYPRTFFILKMRSFLACIMQKIHKKLLDTYIVIEIQQNCQRWAHHPTSRLCLIFRQIKERCRICQRVSDHFITICTMFQYKLNQVLCRCLGTGWTAKDISNRKDKRQNGRGKPVALKNSENLNWISMADCCFDARVIGISGGVRQTA